MRRSELSPFAAAALALTACSAGPPRTSAADELGQSQPITAARLQLRGDEVVGVAVPIDPIELPAVVRTTFDAIAPQGEVLFLGRERGTRGVGYRIEKRYRAEDGSVHRRSVLADDAGVVLERSHSVPVPDVPEHVLAAALRSGRFVDEADVVSGPEREEYWSLVVHDRRGERHVLRIDLAGDVLLRWRRVEARVDAAVGIR